MLRPQAETEHIAEPVAESTAQIHDDEVAASREIRRFRACVAEAVENAVHILCQDIAAEVVARELQLSPAAISEIVARALKRYEADNPVCVRVHPDDVSQLQTTLRVVGDVRLRRGDAILEVRDGFIDASLGVRLESILATR